MKHVKNCENPKTIFCYSYQTEQAKEHAKMDLDCRVGKEVIKMLKDNEGSKIIKIEENGWKFNKDTDEWNYITTIYL
jgi:hypothetical protein